MENEMLTAALSYLARGWSVLPLCPPDHVGTGKQHRGCGSPGKRPFFPITGSGDWKKYQTERASEEELRKWWDHHPRLNVGAAMGPVSGMIGIDVDDEDGEVILQELSKGDLPQTWEYTTGKGRRLLYRLPEGCTVTSHSFKRPGTEIEILRFMSAGGQVVLPPSIHRNGAVYKWTHSPDEIPAADVPEWLRGKINHESESPSRPVDGEMITEGGRNNYLISLAGAMRKCGADQEAIAAALRSTNESRFDPRLEESEVLSVARSACRYTPDEYSGVTIKQNKPAADSVAPPQPGSNYDRRFKWSSELAAPEKEHDWLWHGYLPRGSIVLLSALWKVGKTTLMAHLLRAFAANGTFLGQKISASRILYVSEEGETHWVRRRDSLGIGDQVGYYLQPFKSKPMLADWVGFISRLRMDVEEHKFDLVIFDTLAKLWPVKEENDAGAVDESLMPLWELTKAGAGVLLIHHLRKSGGAEYTGSRGSGALSAFPDIVMELTRLDITDNKSRKRVIKAKGRFDETPDELILELNDGVYTTVREPGMIHSDGKVIVQFSESIAVTTEARIEKLLSECESGWMTSDELQASFKAMGWHTRASTIRNSLFGLYEKKQILVAGTVRSKTDPRKFAMVVRFPDLSPSPSTPQCQNGTEMFELPDSD